MKPHNSEPGERRLREPISFLLYDLILIALAYMTADMVLKLLCIALSMLTAIRSIQLFADLMLSKNQYVDDEIEHVLQIRERNITE